MGKCHAYVFKRIRAGRFGEPVLALDRIDVNAKQVIAALETFEYFVSHPWARISIRADKDAGIAGVVQPAVDEPLESSFTLLLGGFPDRRVVETRGLTVGLCQSVIPDYVRTEVDDILIMEGEKYAVCHIIPCSCPGSR